MRIVAVVTGWAVLTGLAVGAEPPRPFLFLKTGEKFATQETAGPTVAGLTSYVGERLGGATNTFEPRLFNEPVKAAEFCAAAKPPLGIVTPGFYLAYAKALGIEPLLEVRREKVATERCVLVAKKDASEKLSDWQDKIVATTLAGEQRYVIGVILQDKLGRELRLRPTTDVEGAVFELVDGTKGAADGVLMEEATWKSLFEPDAELGPKLKVVYQSEQLPRDLVVVFRPNAGSLDTEKLKTVLKEMTRSENGQKALRSIRVEAFTDVDQTGLTKAQSLFHAQ